MRLQHSCVFHRCGSGFTSQHPQLLAAARGDLVLPPPLFLLLDLLDHHHYEAVRFLEGQPVPRIASAPLQPEDATALGSVRPQHPGHWVRVRIHHLHGLPIPQQLHLRGHIHRLLRPGECSGARGVRPQDNS